MADRRDLFVSNETDAFVLTSASRWSSEHCGEHDDWRKAVEAGIFLPLSAADSCCLNALRLVIGELDESEEQESLGVRSWKLQVPCGELTIGHGNDIIEDPDSPLQDDDTWETEYPSIDFLKIPPGTYRVDVHTLMSPANADWLRFNEPLGAWFRRTRPDEEMPGWLRAYLVEKPSRDPGHESEWEEADDEIEGYADHAEETGQLDFLVQLRPLASAPPLEGEPPLAENGWFPFRHGRRTPARMPLGICGSPDAMNERDSDRQPENLRPTRGLPCMDP